MSKKKQTGPARASAPLRPARAAGDGALMTTRIDPPHQIGAAEPDAATEPATTFDIVDAPRPESTAPPGPAWQEAARGQDGQPAADTMPLGLTFEQVQNQAAQLAAQLSKQQASLDHREAEVNARAAAVESQVRTARLWLVEKLDELSQRAAEQGAAGPTAANEPSADAAHHGSPAGDATGGFDIPRFWNPLHWQEEFERWRSAREAASEGTADEIASHDREPAPSSGQASAAGESERRLAAAERQLAARSAELEARRRELQEERESLEAERDALESERDAFVAERQAERHRLADQRRQMSEKLMRQRARLRRRRDDFDAREMALRQLRAELLRTQQQTLEMRLGAEEQWARLRGKAGAEAGPARGDRRNPAGDAQREGAA